MAGLKLIASSRPVFNAGAATITYTLPFAPTAGDLLVIVLVRDFAEPAFATPSGWTLLTDNGSDEAKIALLAKLSDGSESAVEVTLTGATTERQGQLLIFRAGAPTTLVEAVGSSGFAATMAPDTPSLTTEGAALQSLQAINLALLTMSSDGAVTMSPPTGFTTLDAYSSSLASSRSILVAIRTVAATGGIYYGAADSNANATGRAWLHVLRDRLPIQPREIADVVPGNIGLIG
jgi:hypothetical protein